MKIKYSPIGIVRSEFKTVEQHDEFENKGKGIIEIYPGYVEGLDGLETHFSHCLVIYHMHKVEEAPLKVTPFGDPKYPLIGVFASGGPIHPNPIGVTPCRITKIEGNRMYLDGLDAMNGSPVLDIKPYSSQHYGVKEARVAQWEKDHHGADPHV